MRSHSDKPFARAIAIVHYRPLALPAPARINDKAGISAVVRDGAKLHKDGGHLTAMPTRYRTNSKRDKLGGQANNAGSVHAPNGVAGFAAAAGSAINLPGVVFKGLFFVS